MNKHELKTLLKKHSDTKTIIVDVTSLDTLPAKPHRKRPCAYISNTAKLNEIGVHWICFFFTSKDQPNEYFDPYGLPPSKREFTKFLGRKKCIYNNRQIQGLSTVCGQYCMFFILKRAQGYTMKEIIEKFSPYKLKANDRKVNKAIEEIFKIKKSIFDIKFLHSSLIRLLQQK
jgi:hypothetical protein